jgi:hypothetical protein
MQKEELKNICPAESKRAWATPQLRVLPVPTNTQGGFYELSHQDHGVFYRLS